MSDKTDAELGIYRKVHVKMWSDAKFKRLTPSQPSGQALWIFLITGPATCIVPGVILHGRYALAEMLGWLPEPSTKPFREPFLEAFDELLREGLAKASWEHRLVFLPNAIKYNPPANPNVLKGWRSTLSIVPDCPLKYEILYSIKDHCYQRGRAFIECFNSTFAPMIETLSGTVQQTLSETIHEIREQGTENSKKKDIVRSGDANEFFSQPKKSAKTKPNRSPEIPTNTFQQFYDVFPKHVGKIEAEKSFTKAVKGGVDPEAIICGAKQYREYVSAKGTEKQFIQAPAAWLNKGRWMDELNTVAFTVGLASGGHESISESRWKAMLTLYCKSGEWKWGHLSPEPSHVGCIIPSEILAEFADNLPSHARVLTAEHDGVAA